MPSAVKNKPTVVTYPRLDGGSSSSKPAKNVTGSKFFKDVYYSIQIVSNVLLYSIDKPSYIAGLVLGAAKPVADFFNHSTVPKKGVYEAREQDTGDLFVMTTSDQYSLKKLTYLFCVAAPILLVQHYKNTYPIPCHLITLMISAKTGFEWAQRTIQWLNPPPKD